MVDQTRKEVKKMEMTCAVQQSKVLPAIVAGAVTTVRANLTAAQLFAPVSLFAQNLLRIRGAAEANGDPQMATKQPEETGLPVAVNIPGNTAASEAKREGSGS